MLRATLTGATFSVLMCAACGDPGGAPLGGPYGGAGGYVPPGQPDAETLDPDSGTAPPPEDSGVGSPDSGDPDSGPVDSGGPSDSGHDAGHDAGHDTGAPAPTWTEIYDSYIKKGTIGGCGGCHTATTAHSAYMWLENMGQISGTSSAIVTSGSEITWFGGFMPPGGPTSAPKAAAEMEAWVAAGALEN